VIIALEVPLAINLQKRALAELQAQAVVQAQTVAASIGGEGITNAQADLQRILRPQPGVRVVVVDANGALVADSHGDQFLGEQYATPERPELQQALSTGQPVTLVRKSEDLGQDILTAAAPIVDEDEAAQHPGSGSAGVVGAVRISESMAELAANMRTTILGLAVIGLVALLGGMLVAYLLAGSLARPLSRLADTAGRLGEGDLSARAGELGGATEIEEVAESFDEMADRLEAAIRAQRAFVANASHQLRTPLTGMKLRLETAMEEAPPGDFRRQLEAADKEVDRLSEIVDDLLATSRERETTETHGEASADLGRAATRAVSRWEAKAVRARATLTASGPGAVAAASEPDVDQILDNLIDNALSHAPGSAVAVVADRTGEGALLAIQDDGPGIRAEELDLVTERFYRGKGATPGGSGLGLAIVRELAERWGGRLEVHSAPREGTRVQVTFPAVG